MQVYWSARAGGARPRIARVVYRLVPVAAKRANAPQSYALMRQESSNLDFDAYKSDAAQPIRAFELIDGIKELKISFGAQIEKKEEGKKAAAQAGKKQGQKKPETTYKKFDDWNVEEQQEQEQEKRRIVPHDVDGTLTLWDAQKKYTTTINFKIAILPDLELQEQAPAEKKIPMNTMINALNGAQEAMKQYNEARAA